MMKYRKNEICICGKIVRFAQRMFSFPEDGKTFDYKLFAQFVLIRAIFGFPILFGLMGHLYQSLKKNYVYEIVYGLYCINFVLMYYSANIVMFWRGNQLLKFLKSLSDIRSENLKDYDRTAHNIELITDVIYYSGILVTTAVTAESYLINNFCNNGELINDPFFICGSVVPIWSPFRTEVHIAKPICAMYIYILIILQAPGMLSFSVLYYASVGFITMKIDHLVIMLEEIDFKHQTADVSRQKLRCCVDYFNGISSLVNYMNDSIGYIFAPTHNAYNTIMMGILGYLAIKLGSLPNGLQLIIWIFVQWLSCYCGQILENASFRLQEKVYGLSWYHMDKSHRNLYKIFHAQVIATTFHMKIQPIMHLNMEAFFSILKGTYSFLMFLLKM